MSSFIDQLNYGNSPRSGSAGRPVDSTSSPSGGGSIFSIDQLSSTLDMRARNVSGSGAGDSSISPQSNSQSGFWPRMWNGLGDLWNEFILGTYYSFFGFNRPAAGNIWNSFFSQFRGPTNRFAHGDNSNCGPDALGMAGEYLGADLAGRLGVLDINPYNAHYVTHELRELMGAGQDESKPTTGVEIEQGAKGLGLDARAYKGSLDAIKQEITNGKVAIVNVNSKKYGGNFAQHWIVVTKIDETRKVATILDPQFDGPREISLSRLTNAMKSVGNYMVGVGK